MAKYDDVIAHAWAHEHDMPPQKHSRMYFTGRTIYSYGNHFPIARIMPDSRTVVFTTQGYSNTTSKHKNSALEAVSHKRIIYCPSYLPEHQSDAGPGDRNILSWMGEMKELYDCLIKARKPESWVLKIERLRNTVREYIDYFGIKLKRIDDIYLFDTSMEQYKEQVEKAAAKDKKERELAMKNGAKLHTDWLAAWRDSNEYEFSKGLNRHQKNVIEMIENEGKDANFVRLRVRGTALLTGKGISIPLAIAERYYHKYIAVVNAGGCSSESSDCNYEMVGYTVEEMTEAHLKIGCHDIPRSEIDYIAGLFGWWNTAASK